MSDSNVKYDDATASVLEDPAARYFLMSDGLPVEHLLFGAHGLVDVSVRFVGQDREVLCVGEVGDGEQLCLDVVSGEVVVVHPADTGVRHVNEGVQQFAQSLAAFAEHFPFHERGAEREVCEAAAQEFQACLVEIDRTALSEDPGFWFSLLHDIAIGDYSDDE